MHRFCRSCIVAVLVLPGVLFLSAGCAHRTKAVVKGKVAFFGKNLTAGTVAFQSQDGKRIGSGTIDFNGNYTVPDAPVGPCTVVVRVPHVSRMPSGMKGGPKPPGNMPPMRPPGGDAGADESAPLVDPSKIVEIPGKYAKAETSGLTYTVEPGEQNFDITLSP